MINRHNMINFPSVTAASVSVILPDDGPAPGIHPQSGVSAHGSGFLPNGLDYIRGERLARGVSIWLALHECYVLLTYSSPAQAYFCNPYLGMRRGKRSIALPVLHIPNECRTNQYLPIMRPASGTFFNAGDCGSPIRN